MRVARIFNTYGPRMRPDDGRIVSNFVTQALRRQPLTIYGTGEQTRSLCYVSDVVDGLQRLIDRERAPDLPLNLGNPDECSVKLLAALVLELTGSTSPMVHRPLPADDPQCRRPNIALARALLDWQPTIPIRQGLLRTIAWFGTMVKGPALPLAKEAALFAPLEARVAPEAR